MGILFRTNQLETKSKVLEFIEEWNAPAEFLVVKTSGSTGQPKEVKLLKKHMIASAQATGDFLGLKKGNSALLCLSVDTIGGRMMIVRSLVLGLELVVSDVSSSPLHNIEDHIDFCAMVPMQVQNSLNEHTDRLSKIDKLIIGGGPVSTGLIDQLQEIPTEAFHTFGMTETISHIAMKSLNHPLENEFRCLPNVQIESNNGALVISAPNIGVSQLETNDEVEITSNNRFKWLGRSDFVINSGGVKLHPEEIEAKLSDLITQPFFVFGEKDDFWGEKLILLIENRNELNITKNDLSKVVSKFAIPKEIRYIAEFTYTKSGKINRLISQELPNVAQQVL